MDKNTNYIYRFRSIQKLIKYKELKNNEIYFSTLQELNDPIECFVNVYWLGDKILWENFFRYFLFCFSIAFTEHLQDGQKKKFTNKVFTFFNSNTSNSEKEIAKPNKSFEDFWQYFYRYSSLGKILTVLSKRKNDCQKTDYPLT